MVGKEGEGASQGTCMRDLWAWSMGWGLTVGVRGWEGQARAMEGKVG